MPTFSLDSGMRFGAKRAAVRAIVRIQTLEPRLFCSDTPYRNQSYVPLFDTAAADFGLAELFMENSFVGNDRVSDANRATAALTHALHHDPSSGDERARFVLARSNMTFARRA